MAGPKVAILATGNEIVQGDTPNSNGSYMSQICCMYHGPPSLQILIPDQQVLIEKAIHYALQDHQILIIIGGLGPTSDDRTRFAVSNVLNKPLEFNAASWRRIQQRFVQYQLLLTDNNRQQAYFPQEADIIPNLRGTADGFILTDREHIIVVLPGPPNECLPLFNHYVLPKLLENGIFDKIYQYNWMLLGVSESLVAAALDSLVTNCTQCEIAYQVSYPYLKVKLSAHRKPALTDLSQKIAQKIAMEGFMVVSQNGTTASDLLKQYLIKNQNYTLSIDDQATGGHLASKLLNPDTVSRISFNKKKSSINVNISGLLEYWRAEKKNQTWVKLAIKIDKHRGLLSALPPININLALRGEQTLSHAVELICHYLLQVLLGKTINIKS